MDSSKLITEVTALHKAMGYDYPMPDLNAPQFILKREVRNKRGQLEGYAGLRLEAEAYLWLDPRLPIGRRFRVMLELHRELASVAYKTGLDCVVAYLPPSVPKAFRRILRKLGWERARKGWEPWSRPIE